MTEPLAKRIDTTLEPDPARVLARLFLPGEELIQGRSRAREIVDRVLAIDEDQVVRMADGLVADFGDRHRDYAQLVTRNAAAVRAHLSEAVDLSSARRLVLGASFTSEYSIEAAALCNPSAVLHPDQSNLGEGEARVALSLRGIGEGHVSSISFSSAVVGPGPQWRFAARPSPVSTGVVASDKWQLNHFRAVVTGQSRLDELGQAVLHALPEQFDRDDLERALAGMGNDLLAQPGASATTDLFRRTVISSYRIDFPADISLDQSVLFPASAEESNGMEDARFTRFVHADGTVEYRATYTAYDGRRIAPRVLTSPDLREFRAKPLGGPAARNKGMALFPRKVNGEYLSLCRSDGENISLAHSDDGFVWDRPQLLQGPAATWEVLQVGNCGPPIETEHGWLVLTHGVGAMRVYSIGALLLDLEDPSRIIDRLRRPLLAPVRDERDGYVPNVVYSCGGLIHDGLLWLPVGIDDARIGVAYVPMDQLLAELSTTS